MSGEGIPDWAGLVAESAARSPRSDGTPRDDVHPFLDAVENLLSTPQFHFKTVQQSLQQSFFKTIPAARSLDFLVSCLEELIANAPVPPVAVTEQAGVAGTAEAAAAGTSPESVEAAAAAAAAPATDAAEAGVDAAAASEAVAEYAAAEAAQTQAAKRQKEQQQQQQQQNARSGTLSHLLLDLIQQHTRARAAAAAAAAAIAASATPAAPAAGSAAAPPTAPTASASVFDMVLASAAETDAVAEVRAAAAAARAARVQALFAAAYSQPRHARVALKIAQAFGITSEDLPPGGPQALAAAVSGLLLDRVTLTPGLGLVGAFPALSSLVDRPALLRLLVAEGKEAAAEKWAAGLARADQILYVQICIDADRLKSAARATRLFGLRQEFPDIESRYRRSSLARLASKRVWGVAAAFVGTDAELQTELLRAMVESGEGGLAEEYRKRFGLPASLMAALIDPEALAAQEAARAAKYLPLALPLDRVIWADGPAGLAAAAEALSGARVLGLDVEWKASGRELEAADEAEAAAEGETTEGETTEGDLTEGETTGSEAEAGGGKRKGGSARGAAAAAAAAASGPGGLAALLGAGAAAGGGGGGGSPAALLQVATAEWAVLFDLIALCGPGSSNSSSSPGGEQGGDPSAAAAAAATAATAAQLDLDSVLLPLFSRTPAEGGCLVLGFGLSGDLAKLSGSYPAVAAFRRVAASLDVWELWRAHLIAQAQAARPKGAPPVQLPARAFQAGLSTLAAGLLGKPLDKTMQVSDWEARPLSARQVTYAAQDAHVLVRLYGELRNRLPAGVADQVEAAKTVPYVAGAPPPPVGPAAAGGGGGSRSNGGTPQKRKGGAAAAAAAAYPAPLTEGEEPERGPTGQAEPAVAATATAGPGSSCQPRSPARPRDGEGGDGGGGTGGGGIGGGGGGASSRGVDGGSGASTSGVGGSIGGGGGGGGAGGAGTGGGGGAGGGSGSGTRAAASVLTMPTSGGTIKALSRAYGDTLPVVTTLAASALAAPPQPLTPTAVGGCSSSSVGGGAEAAAGGAGVAPEQQLPLGVAAALTRHGLGSAVWWLQPGQPAAAAAGGADAVAASAAQPPQPPPPPQSPSPVPAPASAGSASASAADTPSALAPPAPAPAPLPPTATAAEAAAAVGVPTCRIAKSIAVLAAGKPWLAAVRGDRRLDWHKVAAAVGVARRALRVATPGECVSAYGYVPGTLPPFGHPVPVPVLVDEGLRWVAEQQVAAPAVAAADVGAASDAPSSAAALTLPNHTTGDAPQPSPPLQTAPSPASWSASPPSPSASPFLPLSPAPCSHGPARPGLLFCGSGVAAAVVGVTFPQLLQLTGGRTADIAADDDGGGGAISAPSSAGPSASPSPAASYPNLLSAGAGGAAAAAAVEAATAATAASAGPPSRFLLDSMLGRLCRWLRCLGLDAEYVGRTSPGKQELARLTARAAAEGRVFLTRDQRLAERRDVAAPYVLGSDDPQQQLDELADHYGVRFDEALVMSRCNACNAAAFQLVSPKEAARELVPPRVYDLVDEFWRCGCCGKVFWMGPKSASAIALVEGMLARARQPGEPLAHSFFNDGYLPPGAEDEQQAQQQEAGEGPAEGGAAKATGEEAEPGGLMDVVSRGGRNADVEKGNAGERGATEEEEEAEEKAGVDTGAAHAVAEEVKGSAV